MARDQRRLAAIISADVAGYSRLMGEDESRTLAALKAHRRELIDPKIAEYGGRIVKTSALEAIAMGTRLDPNSVNALTERAWLMSNMGRPGDALKLADQAMALDPANFASIEMACDAHV